MTVNVSGSLIARVATLVGGLVAFILPQVASWGLSATADNLITGFGGVLLAILALLEHPTTKTAASATFTQPAAPASQETKSV